MLHATGPDGAARPTPPAARLAAAILPVVAASLLGGYVTRPKIPTWYAALAKPAFTPPNWVFAPVWTLLFGLMAVALWRILARPAGPTRTRAVAAFFGQLALNVAWSFAFFGLESPGLALAVILALLAAILATMRLFAPLDRPAAWLLAPYAAWVAYAAALNLGVLILN